MKKAELEAHRDKYLSHISKAHIAEHDKRPRDAVKSALAACEYLDGMMQFERKYADAEFDTVAAIELVVRHAPPLMDTQSLDVIENLLVARKRIERDTSGNMAERVASARSNLWDYYRLWEHLETHPDCSQDELAGELGGKQKYWLQAVDTWVDAGVVCRTFKGDAQHLSLATRMDDPASAICSGCGALTSAIKSTLLSPISCPACGETKNFVLLD